MDEENELEPIAICYEKKNDKNGEQKGGEMEGKRTNVEEEDNKWMRVHRQDMEVRKVGLEKAGGEREVNNIMKQDKQLMNGDE